MGVTNDFRANIFNAWFSRNRDDKYGDVLLSLIPHRCFVLLKCLYFFNFYHCTESCHNLLSQQSCLKSCLRKDQDYKKSLDESVSLVSILDRQVITWSTWSSSISVNFLNESCDFCIGANVFWMLSDTHWERVWKRGKNNKKKAKLCGCLSPVY